MAKLVAKPAVEVQADRPAVEVRRSARRTRTVSAHRDGERIVVLVPARLSRAEEARWVEQIVTTVLDREARARVRGPKASDEALRARADQLNATYFEGRADPASIRWVDNMNQRWGSCTPTDRTIRISSRIRELPDWVIDSVIVHELAHLLVNGHGPRFWALANRFERMERARGFLHGWSSALGQTEEEPD